MGLLASILRDSALRAITNFDGQLLQDQPSQRMTTEYLGYYHLGLVGLLVAHRHQTQLVAGDKLTVVVKTNGYTIIDDQNHGAANIWLASKHRQQIRA